MKTLIPLKLRKLIENSPYSGGVQQTFDRFVPLLGNTNTGLYFFPEFTDHGPDHIAGVLASATKLIPNKVWKLLTPEDGVLIALSALLHDVAMVLTADGLMNLLSTDRTPTIEEFDEKSWTTLFEDFFSDARRWDDRKVLRILGDKDNREISNLRKDIAHVKERPDSEDWSIRYRKFLGEFVRWHHARLAHEIACAGFPGSSPLNFTGISSEVADIVGLVARSHNLNPRQTYEYLDHKYDGHIVCRGTHPIYAMVLLRIADYLQLDAKRRNASWNTVQRLRSPISQDEWDAHLGVKEIRPDDADPEALFISAIPESAANFLKIKKLLGGLQQELDLSWAVTSEVYGRSPDLKDYGITLRRIRSNLDDEREFVRKNKPKYFPTRAVFDTAGASLLKLLIRPLYGDKPEVGVRELMQNSVDAVRELTRLRETHSSFRKTKTLNQKTDVLISISQSRDGKHVLRVSDKGVGMTFSTVRDYFLKAGVSFRESDTWQKEFVEDGRPEVLRSGRFGVGALAAFLLGDRLKVITRSVWSEPEDGVSFEAGVEDDSIELKRVKVDRVGTTIEIILTEDVAKFLINAHTLWDWYVFEKPSVTRVVLGQKLEQKLFIPSNSYPHWLNVSHPDYREILWSYSNFDLACNGIRIYQRGNLDRYGWGPNAVDTACSVPSISVLDYNAVLPLTLQRDRLEVSFFPFSSELAREVTKDFCAYVLTHGPTTSDPFRLFYPLAPRAAWSAFPGIGSLIATSEGCVLLHPWHVRQCGLLHVFASTENLKNSSVPSRIATRNSGYSTSTFDAVWFIREQVESRAITRRLTDDKAQLVGIRMLITNIDILRKKHDLDPEYDMKDLVITRLDGDLLFEGGHLRSSRDYMLEVHEEITDWDDEPTVTLELFFDPTIYDETSSPFIGVWRNIMGSAVMPFDLDQRRHTFKTAYQELAEYLSLWSEPLPGSWRDKVQKQTLAFR